MSLEPLNLSALLVMLALVVGFALPLNALVRHTRRPAYFLGLYVIGYAGMVLIVEAAHLMRAVRMNTLVIFAVVLCTISIIVWRKKGKPDLWGPVRSAPLRPPSFSADYALWLLGAGVASCLLVIAALIVLTPPNNYDSMTYHLSRVGYWMQHQSLRAWPTPNFRQVTFPINAEVGILWTILFGGNDRAAGFIQWVAAVTCFLSIAGTSRMLGASLRGCLFAGFVTLTFPIVLLQAGTTQNDLVAASFVSTCLYLFFSGIRQKRPRFLLLSALAFGLAAGTKVTVIIAFPGLALAALLFWVNEGKSVTRLFFSWVGFCAAAFLLLGSFTYIQNTFLFGNPVSTGESINPPAISQGLSRSKTIARNLALYSYQWLDFTGLPQPLAAKLSGLKYQLTNRFAGHFHLAIQPNNPGRQYQVPVTITGSVPNEETSWFGPLGALLMVIGGLFSAWKAIITRRVTILLPLIFFLSFLFTIAILMGWSPYRGRYFVLPLIVFAPALAWTYPQKDRLGWLRIGISVVALVVAAVTITTNAARPLTGPAMVWKQDPLTVRTISLPDQRIILDAIQHTVPESAVLATRLGADDWDYPLFGASLKRRVVQLDPSIRSFSSAALPALGASYLLVSPIERNFLGLPEGLHLLQRFPNDWLLFEVSTEPVTNFSQEDNTYLLGSADSSGLFHVADDLVGKIGLTQIKSAAYWGIEQNPMEEIPFQGFYWFGPGEGGALGIRIWSNLNQEQPAVLNMDLLPGPARNDPARTLVVKQNTRSQTIITSSVTQSFTFNSATVLQVPLIIQPGINELLFMISEDADNFTPVNGDTRPLMAMLRSMELYRMEK